MTSADDRRPVELTFDPDRLVRNVFVTCAVLIVSFVLLDFIVNYRGLSETGSVRRLFNTGRDDSLAGWFSVTLTWMVGLTLWLTFLTVRQQGGGRFRTVGWLVLAIFLTYMAVDDGAHVHERLGTAFERAQEGEAQSWGSAVLGAFPSYAWQILFVPVYGALGLFMLVFLWRELAAWRLKILVAVALGCFVLAVGLDFAEGLSPRHPWNPYALLANSFDLDVLETRTYSSEYSALRHLSRSIEESLEMLGMSILWVAFLWNWTSLAENLHVRFAARPRGAV